LELTEKVEKIARIYMEKLGIPKKALRDAAHLAVASVHNIDYLVTMKRKVSMKFLKE